MPTRKAPRATKNTPTVTIIPTVTEKLFCSAGVEVTAVVVGSEVGVVPASGANPRTTTDHREGVIEEQGFVWFNATLKNSDLRTAEDTHKIGSWACLDGGTKGQQCKRISNHVLR